MAAKETVMDRDTLRRELLILRGWRRALGEVEGWTHSAIGENDVFSLERASEIEAGAAREERAAAEEAKKNELGRACHALAKVRLCEAGLVMERCGSHFHWSYGEMEVAKE